MIYKHKKTGNTIDFDISEFKDILIESTYDKETNQYFKVVEIFDCGVIVRRVMTEKDILLTNKDFRFLVNKEWFYNNYEEVKDA